MNVGGGCSLGEEKVAVMGRTGLPCSLLLLLLLDLLMCVSQLLVTQSVGEGYEGYFFVQQAKFLGIWTPYGN